MTYDYEDRMVVIGPLGLLVEPHAYDLCEVHAARVTVPDGWTVLRPVLPGHEDDGDEPRE